MKNWKLPLTVVLTALVIGGLVYAGGESLMQGQDSNKNVQYILVDSLGRIVPSPLTGSTNGASGGSTHGACTYTQVSASTVSAACPPTPLVGRSTITWQLYDSAQTLNVTSGPTAASDTNGVKIGTLDAYTDNFADSVATSCRCSTNGCTVLVTECP